MEKVVESKTDKPITKIKMIMTKKDLAELLWIDDEEIQETKRFINNK